MSLVKIANVEDKCFYKMQTVLFQYLNRKPELFGLQMICFLNPIIQSMKCKSPRRDIVRSHDNVIHHGGLEMRSSNMADQIQCAQPTWWKNIIVSNMADRI